MLKEYALTTMVERRVESIHAIVNMMGKLAPHAFAPFLCSKVREKDHLDLLKTNIRFHEFCLENFRLRGFLDLILQQRCSRDELSGMSPSEKPSVFTNAICFHNT